MAYGVDPDELSDNEWAARVNEWAAVERLKLNNLKDALNELIDSKFGNKKS